MKALGVLQQQNKFHCYVISTTVKSVLNNFRSDAPLLSFPLFLYLGLWKEKKKKKQPYPDDLKTKGKMDTFNFPFDLDLLAPVCK